MEYCVTENLPNLSKRSEVCALEGRALGRRNGWVDVKARCSPESHTTHGGKRGTNPASCPLTRWFVPALTSPYTNNKQVLL